MIDAVHQYLLKWGEAVKGGIGAAGVSSLWERIVAGEQGSGGGAGLPFSEMAYETEKAVQALPVGLKRIVMEVYLNTTSTEAQKLIALGLSKRTLYRRLDQIHQQIEASLATALA
ncbi:MAG: hypothetical protein RPT11_02965 [Bermanella sp.]